MIHLLEKDIQDLMLDWLRRQRNTYVWRQNAGSMYADSPTGRHGFRAASVNGISDIIGIWNGYPLAIEVKQPKKKPTEIQREFLHNFSEAGGLAIVAHSLEELQAVLKEIEDNYDSVCPHRSAGIYYEKK